MTILSRQVVFADKLEAYAEFGAAVAMNRHMAVVGSGPRSNRVSIFMLNEEDEWIYATDLQGENVWEDFGIAVSINTDIIAIGSLDKVHLYSTVPNFTQLMKLEEPSKIKDTGYGTGGLYSFDSSLLVGAPLSENGHGVVFIYDQRGKLKRKLEEVNAFLFGQSLVINKNYIAIGAPGGQRGSVYLYDYASTSFKCKLTGDLDLPLHDAFGSSIALFTNDDNLNLIAIGAPLDDTTFEDAGSVSIYDNCHLRLRISGSKRGQFFGTSISFSSDWLIIGSGDSSEYVILITTIPFQNNLQNEEDTSSIIQLNVSGEGGPEMIEADHDWVLVGTPKASYNPSSTLRAAGAAIFLKLAAPDMSHTHYKHTSTHIVSSPLKDNTFLQHPLSRVASGAAIVTIFFYYLAS